MGGVLLQTEALSSKQALPAAAASVVTAISYCGFPFPSSVSSGGSERSWALQAAEAAAVFCRSIFWEFFAALCFRSDRPHEYLGNLLRFCRVKDWAGVVFPGS